MPVRLAKALLWSARTSGKNRARSHKTRRKCMIRAMPPPKAPFSTACWRGNRKVGEGRNAIGESRTPEFARLKSGFPRPFNGTRK